MCCPPFSKVRSDSALQFWCLKQMSAPLPTNALTSGLDKQVGCRRHLLPVFWCTSRTYVWRNWVKQGCENQHLRKWGQQNKHCTVRSRITEASFPMDLGSSCPYCPTSGTEGKPFHLLTLKGFSEDLPKQHSLPYSQSLFWGSNLYFFCVLQEGILAWLSVSIAQLDLLKIPVFGIRPVTVLICSFEI